MLGGRLLDVSPGTSIILTCGIIALAIVGYFIVEEVLTVLRSRRQEKLLIWQQRALLDRDAPGFPVIMPRQKETSPKEGGPNDAPASQPVSALTAIGERCAMVASKGEPHRNAFVEVMPFCPPATDALQGHSRSLGRAGESPHRFAALLRTHPHS
jgi:hypothetical protein